MSYDEMTAKLLRENEQQAARIEQLEAALHAWNAACHINPMMEGPRFLGVSPILAQKACMLTIAALGEKP